MAPHPEQVQRGRITEQDSDRPPRRQRHVSRSRKLPPGGQQPDVTRPHEKRHEPTAGYAACGGQHRRLCIPRQHSFSTCLREFLFAFLLTYPLAS